MNPLAKIQQLAKRIRSRREPSSGSIQLNEPRPSRERRGALAIPPILQPLVALVGEKFIDTIDVLSSQLLSIDPIASELAVLVERAREQEGDEAIHALVMRHNLVLDGTLIEWVRPLLTQTSRPTTDALLGDRKSIQRARDTIELLVDGLLDATGEGLEDYVLLDAWLTSNECAEVDQRVILASYVIFLQTFLVRSLAKTVTETMVGKEPALPRDPNR